MWELKKKGRIPKLNNPVLIAGLPGIGNVGKIAVDFAVDELKAKKLYSLFSSSLPNSVFVNEQNLVELPMIEVWYKKLKGKKRDLLFLTGDVQPVTEESSYSFCDVVVEMLQSFGGSELVTTGGIGLNAVPDKPKVFITGNEKSLIDKYSKGLKVEKQIHGVVGPIIGATGLLIGVANMKQVDGVALLAETFGHPMYLGVKGAHEILRVLNKQFFLKLDLKSLSKEIESLQRETIKKTHDLSKVSKSLKKETAEISYIG